MARIGSSRWDDAGASVDALMQRFDPQTLDSFTPQQRDAISTVLSNLSRPARPPQLINFRFVVDLMLTRFYVVLLVGKDRRARQRSTRLNRIGNIIAAALFLVVTNLVISAVILLSLYLTKSALGIDILPGHFAQYLQEL